VTTGKIYQEVIARERRGDYLGATVQVIRTSRTSSRRRSFAHRVTPRPMLSSSKSADRR